MNRVQEMDQILKDLYISAQNNRCFLTTNLVYNYLIKRSVFTRDLDKNINGVTFDELGNYEYKPIQAGDFFSSWIKRFENKQNIEVFCDPSWRYFCQFVNGDISTAIRSGDLDCIKMYIPLDYDHLYEGANRIFDYLERENICHLSKISSRIRFDDIVVRLASFEDARKLQYFIDNDRYIQAGLIKGNAFAFQTNGISYAMDGRISYNNYIASLMSGYINEQIKNGRNSSINTVGIQGFLQYIKKVADDFGKIEAHLKDDDSELVSKDEIADAYGVLRLLELAISSNDMNKFYEHYCYLNNASARETLMAAVYNGYVKEEPTDAWDDVTEIGYNYKENLFKEYILTMMKKYPLGSDRSKPDVSGFNYIFSYLNGDDAAVTRDNDLRNRMKKGISRGDIFQIVNDSGVLGNNIREKVTNYVKIVMLNDMIKWTQKRVPNDDIVDRMEEFMQTNELALITNSIGNARQLAKTLDGNAMREFLNSLGIRDFNEYISKYYSEKNYGYNRR